MTCSFPLTTILGGETQNIRLCRSRFWLYTIPAVIAAGNAGGTTIVMMSSVRRIIVPAALWNGNI